MNALVYKVPGLHHGPYGNTYDYKAVHSTTELDEALNDGWFVSLIGACDARKKGFEETMNGVDDTGRARAHEKDGTFKADDPKTPDKNEAYKDGKGPEKPDKAAERVELETQAKELGLTYHPRTGDKKLKKLIDDKLAE